MVKRQAWQSDHIETSHLTGCSVCLKFQQLWTYPKDPYSATQNTQANDMSPYAYACTCACLSVCMHVWMYECIDVWMDACMGCMYCAVMCYMKRLHVGIRNKVVDCCAPCAPRRPFFPLQKMPNLDTNCWNWTAPQELKQHNRRLTRNDRRWHFTQV